ncbi:uncharacterized protein LOC133393105 [Anopheles gambiae]|uniref:uncharacterized protein LOC133393105 n=1 Tax=Anopheles gambiae TaxID=7165 RepID=UPI002AC89826|nr:uncharacterized protein LOC133393105 [Anopheles gambiae]
MAAEPFSSSASRSICISCSISCNRRLRDSRMSSRPWFAPWFNAWNGELIPLLCPSLQSTATFVVVASLLGVLPSVVTVLDVPGEDGSYLGPPETLPLSCGVSGLAALSPDRLLGTHEFPTPGNPPHSPDQPR